MKDYFNKIFPNDIMTNADYIRSMSDEELAEFLCSISNCWTCVAMGTCGIFRLEDERADGMKKWLAEPCEEKKE